MAQVWAWLSVGCGRLVPAEILLELERAVERWVLARHWRRREVFPQL